MDRCSKCFYKEVEGSSIWCYMSETRVVSCTQFKPSSDTIKNLCRPGKGDRCRYLMRGGSKGCQCGITLGLKNVLDRWADSGLINAVSINCDEVL